MSLVVGFCAFKSWQEAVMYVDGMAGMPLAEVCAEDLHVPADMSTLAMTVSTAEPVCREPMYAQLHVPQV